MLGIKAIGPQFTKFILVGGLNTGVDFLVYNLLIVVTGVQAGIGIIFIGAAGFVVANVNSYFLNKNWTFNDKTKKDAVHFATFLLVSIIGLIINVGTIYIITTFIPDFLSISYFLNLFGDSTPLIWANIAKVGATGFSLIWNFVGYKYIVFKK